MLKYNVIAVKNPQTKEVKWCARLAPSVPIKMSALAEAISKECTVTVHDVKAVLSALEEHITTALLNGQSVRLGDLGSFHLTMRSTATETREEFTQKNVKGVSIRFRGSTTMRYNLSMNSPKMSLQSLTEEEGA